MFPGNGRPDYHGFLAYAEFSRIVSARVQPYIISGIFQEIIHSAHGIAIHINERNEPCKHMVGKRPQLLRRPDRERKIRRGVLRRGVRSQLSTKEDKKILEFVESWDPVSFSKKIRMPKNGGTFNLGYRDN